MIYESPRIVDLTGRPEAAVGLCQNGPADAEGKCEVGSLASQDCKAGPSAGAKCAPGLGN